jgi:hypothetical protein
VATEKAMLLSGETGGGVPVQINLYPGVAELLHKRYNELVRQIESEAGAESKDALPNGETFPESPAAMGLPSGEENLQK